MKKGTLSDLITLLTSFGRPKTQDQSDAWREYGETFDLYRKPSEEPIAKKTICYIYNKEKENEDDKNELKNLQLIATGERFIAVCLNVFEQEKKPSIKTFVKALNHYNEHGVFLVLNDE